MLMMIIVCIVLLIFLFLWYYAFDQEILSPSFICTGVYLLSCFLMIFYCDRWNVDLRLKTILMILLALISVAAGEYFAIRVNIFSGTELIHIRDGIDDNGDFDENAIVEDDSIKLGRVSLIVCLVFVIVTMYLYYREVLNVVANSAYAQTEYGGTLTLLTQYNRAQTLEDSFVPYYVQHMFTLSGAIAAVQAYVILYNRIWYKSVHNSVLSYITIVVYLATTFLTSGRSKMLSFFIYIICLWLILSNKKGTHMPKNNIKTLAKIILIMAAAILLFYLAGFLTEKSLHYDSFFDNFANYFSSSIYAFNEYIISPKNFSSDSNFFGIHTLSGIYSFLRQLGFQIPSNIVALEYIYCGDYLTNIYTPLRRYLQDFGIIGMAFIMFLIGFAYKKLIQRSEREDGSPLTAIYTAQFIFPLFFMSIEERVFMDVVMMRTVYIIFYIYLVYQWLIHKEFLCFKIKVR